MLGCTIVFGEIGQLAQNAAFGIAAICGNNGALSPVPPEVGLISETERAYRSAVSDDVLPFAAPPPHDLAAPERLEDSALLDSFLAMKSAMRAEKGPWYIGGYAFFGADCDGRAQSGSDMIAGDRSVDMFSRAQHSQADMNSALEPRVSGHGQVIADSNDEGQIRDTAAGNDIVENAYAPGGGLGLNAGYSSVEGISVGGKITRTNIFGPDTELGASARFSKVRTSFELGFTDDDFLGSKYAFAPTLFADRVSSKNFGKGLRLAPFRQSSRGINVLLNRKLDNGFSAAFNYRWSNDSFQMIDKNTNCDSAVFGSALCGTIGKTTSSILSFALTFNRKNQVTEAPRGIRLRVAQDLSVGGSASFARSRIGGEALVGLGGSWNLSLDIEGGYIKRIGNDKIPLFDRFYIGDSTMRGFDLRGLGPKIRPSGVQPAETVGIGGRAYYVVRTELSVAVGGMWGANGVRPGIFIDAGSVFAADRSGTLAGETLLGNSAKPRISLGIGIAMNTPVGRLRIDFAKPILKQLGDRGKLLSVSFGTAM